MKARPWPLIFLASLLVLSPVLSIVACSILLGMNGVQYVSEVLQRPMIQVLEFFCFMPLAGIAIYCVKNWSYPILLCALVWSCVANWSEYTMYPELVPHSFLISGFVFRLALAIYFFLPEVRATYLDAAVRWWEAKPRYTLDTQIQYKINKKPETYHGVLGNASESGLYVLIPQNDNGNQVPMPVEGDIFHFSFQVMSQKFVGIGKIVHIAAKRRSWTCGVQLTHTPATLEHFQRLTQSMELLGVPRQPERVSFFEGLRFWASHVFRTGEGWVPKLPANHPSVWRSAKLPDLSLDFCELPRKKTDAPVVKNEDGLVDDEDEDSDREAS